MEQGPVPPQAIEQPVRETIRTKLQILAIPFRLGNEIAIQAENGSIMSPVCRIDSVLVSEGNVGKREKMS